MWNIRKSPYYAIKSLDSNGVDANNIALGVISHEYNTNIQWLICRKTVPVGTHMVGAAWIKHLLSNTMIISVSDK